MAEVGLKLKMGLGESEKEGSTAKGQREWERERVSPSCRELPVTCRSWRPSLSPPPSLQLFVCPAFFIINFCFKAPFALTGEMCPRNLPKAYQIKNSIMKRKYPKKLPAPKIIYLFYNLNFSNSFRWNFVYQFKPKPLASAIIERPSHCKLLQRYRCS